MLDALGLIDFFSASPRPSRSAQPKPMPGIFHGVGRIEGRTEPADTRRNDIIRRVGSQNGGGLLHLAAARHPHSLRGLLPEDGPRHGLCLDPGHASFRSTMAADAFGASPGDCQPDALICTLGELPALLSRLKTPRGMRSADALRQSKPLEEILQVARSMQWLADRARNSQSWAGC